MVTLRKGQRLALSDLIGDSLVLSITINVAGVAADFACFGLTSEQLLADDAYMTFFNQVRTPCAAVELVSSQNQTAQFNLNLARLLLAIERLVFTATVTDENNTLAALTAGTLTLMNNANSAIASIDFSGVDFSTEKAVMLIELYRKEGDFRLSVNGQGFAGGLAALVKHFGAEVAEVPMPSNKVSLEKKIAEAAPKLVDLAKKATLSLSKHQLTDVVARVGLVLDASGSMTKQYLTGKVQAVINRLLPLAVHFDDDGQLDVWAFSVNAKALASANLSNYADYINTIERGWRNWGMMSINNEPVVLEQVIHYYKNSQLPVLVIFISDGGVSKNKEIQKLLIEAAHLPIFWQFVGIGGSHYGVFEKLDTMSGRCVDNCGFFALDDLESVSEQALYDLLLSEFPQWLTAAKQQHIFE